MRAGGWQHTIGPGLAGTHARHRRARPARRPGGDAGAGVRHDGHRLVAAPDPGARRAGTASARSSKDAAVRRVRRRHDPHAALGRAAAALVGAARPRADEADRLPDQHLARADRRRGRAGRRAARAAHRRRRARRLRHRAAAASTTRCARCRTRCCCRTSATSRPTTTAPGSARSSRTSWPGPTARRSACSDGAAQSIAEAGRERVAQQHDVADPAHLGQRRAPVRVPREPPVADEPAGARSRRRRTARRPGAARRPGRR